MKIFRAIYFVLSSLIRIFAGNKTINMYIAIAGNIGCGKTTLTNMLARHYGWEARFEAVRINEAQHTIIQDRSIFEGVYVFTANNKAMGNLSDRDFDTYMELFEQMMSTVRLPELMIYLRASVPHLVANIQKRGRDYEQTIQLEYLQNLNRRYDDFIQNNYPGRVMTIEKDQLDFLNNPKDFASIVDRIDRNLFGLFSKI